MQRAWERRKVHPKFWSENLKERDYSEDLGVNGTVLECMLEKYGGKCGLDFSVSGKGTVAGSCEHDNETSGSIKGGEFFE